MIFVTIGSFTGFDRMLEMVDTLAGENPDHEWFAQIGDSAYLPKHMDYERFVDKQDFDEHISSADVLIGHAGMGTISAAITMEKPLIVIPRDHERGEHVDDHQFATADLFEQGEHILVAHDLTELRDVWPQTKTFVPKPRASTAEAVGARVGAFLNGLVDSRGSA